jgi:two-component system phosphate regulon sensor histidine kinase PhoR
MDGDHGSAPLSERARSSSWGGPEARAELRRLAEDAGLRAGFSVSEIEVLRGDGLLELVAYAGPQAQEADMGKPFSLSHVRRVLQSGTSYGKLVFLAEEEMDTELQDAVRGYGYVPNVPDSSAPDHWRALDMLVAPLTDRSGRIRAVLHLDEPLSGRRPGSQELWEIADNLELVLQSVMVTVDREELTRQARLDETARGVVRVASQRLGGRDLLAKVHPQLVAGFRAQSLVVRLFDEPDELLAGRSPAAGLPTAMGPAIEAAARRAWASRTVIIAEPGRVWGDVDLDRHHRNALTDHLAAQVVSELLLVPVGAGHEAMGVLVVARDGREDRWTESESHAALGVGHDVGRALLSARAHEREQQLIVELQRLDQYRRQLIDTVSHELRTPLTSIIGYLDLATDVEETIPEQTLLHLAAVSRNSDRLLLLVNDLLSVSEVETGPIRLTVVPTDVATLAGLSLDDIQHRAAEADLTLIRDLSPELMITADPNRLLQVLDNLLSNAIKFTPPGGRITVSAFRNGDGVDVVVRDTGMGIDADSLPHLGTAFFRTPKTGEKGISGVGLGLMITKNIVEAHRGTLTISSREHEGTTVQVHLPDASRTQATGNTAAGPGLAQDVTAARTAEHTLKESEERNRLTFEHAPIGQAIVELNGKWRQVNAALTKLLGFPEDQLLKMTFQDITHPDDLELDLAHLNQLLAGEIDSYQIEKRYFTASGLTVWALLSVALVHDDEGSPLYLIAQIQDISDRKRQQHALQDLTEMLAHDLRTPAAVMLGFSELLEGPAASDVQEVHAYAARISAGARAMTDLLDNALTATALDTGQLIATPQAVSLRGSVETAAQTNDLGSVSIDTSALENVVAWVDPVHLSQVITNLLTNAAKYGGDKITVSATSSHGRVSISIADDGPGVEPDFVPYLFDRFSRSAVARAGRQRGSGLGLYIVRDILAANGGTIRYATSQSGGAEFRIDLCAPRGAAPHHRAGHGTSRGAGQLSRHGV